MSSAFGPKATRREQAAHAALDPRYEATFLERAERLATCRELVEELSDAS